MKGLDVLSSGVLLSLLQADAMTEDTDSMPNKASCQVS